MKNRLLTLMVSALALGVLIFKPPAAAAATWPQIIYIKDNTLTILADEVDKNPEASAGAEIVIEPKPEATESGTITEPNTEPEATESGELENSDGSDDEDENNENSNDNEKEQDENNEPEQDALSLKVTGHGLEGRPIFAKNDFTGDNFAVSGAVAIAEEEIYSGEKQVATTTAPNDTPPEITWNLAPEERDFWTLSFAYKLTTSETLAGFGQPALRVMMCGETAWQVNADQANGEWHEVYIPRGVCGRDLPEEITWQLLGSEDSGAEYELKLAAPRLDLVQIDYETNLYFETESDQLLLYSMGSGINDSGLSPLVVPYQNINGCTELQGKLLDDMFNIVAAAPTTMVCGMAFERPPNTPTISDVIREQNEQLTLEVNADEYNQWASNRYELRIAASATDLINDFDNAPRLELYQSQYLNQVGTWAAVTPNQADLLVTEPVTDEVFYLGLKVRGETWLPSGLSGLWRCEQNYCTADNSI